MSGPLRIAACQYPIEYLGSWDAYCAKLERLVAEAAGQGAKILLFPEYASMELASLLPESAQRDLGQQLEQLQDRVADFRSLHAGLARRHGVYLVAGSFPVRVAEGRYHNRAWLFGPGGGEDFQEKLQMTRFERESWGISPAQAIKVFDTDYGRVGINICYDSEFPLLARAQAAAGAFLILVPSCTDSPAGYYRVSAGCRARAMENQCYVAQAHTVGRADWSEAVDVNTGAAALYGPPDRGFPDDGVLALGDMDRPQWVYGEVDPAAVERVRREGQVFNFRDWDHHAEAARAGATVVRL